MLWVYMVDTCDPIGICDINFKFISADTNLNITEKHLTELGDRVQVLGNGKAFLRKFIDFQYGELTPSCPPHKKLIQAVERIGLRRVGSRFEHPEGLAYDYPNARVVTTLQDKEEEKDRKGQEGGLQRGSTIAGSTVLPAVLASEPRFVAAWKMWLEHLKQKRKPATLHAQDLQLRRCAEWGLERALKAIQASIEHNWQSIYENNGNGMNGAEVVIRGKELERVEKQIAEIRNSVDSHRELDDGDREKLRKLKARRDELKSILGIQV